MRISYSVPPEEFARVARWQREKITEIAAKVEKREPLDDVECEMAAAVLRAGAAQIRDKEPRQRGQAPRICAATVAVAFARMVNREGKRPTHAMAKLAQDNEVSVESIKKAVLKYRKIAERMFPKKRT